MLSYKNIKWHSGENLSDCEADNGFLMVSEKFFLYKKYKI